jgi:hypothetical protein
VHAAAAPADPTARAAAARIARELAANDWRMPSSSDATGMAIDAVALLAASGTGGDAARAALDRLQSDGASWVASSPAGDEGRRAKLAWALQVGGRDASALVAALRDAVQPNGRVGTGTNLFGQAWAVIALARTPEGAPTATVDYLVSLQCTTGGHAQHGGFGFGACSTVDGDATGMAVIALLAAGRAADDPAVARAVGWMQAHQLADGSFPMQYAPKAGNANSTGLVAQAARQVGTPAAVAVADAAAPFVRELQVTCASPIVAGDDPSVGGGFPRSWLGSIAYDAAAQDSAIANGIAPGQQTQWRYATLQGPLGLPGVRGLASLTLDDVAAGVDPLPACGSTVAPPGGTTGGTGTTLPARSLTVRTAPRPVATGARVAVTVRGLAPRERVTLLLSGRVVGRGVASARGVLATRVVVPRGFGSHPRRVLRAIGANARRTGTARLATAAPRALRVLAPSRARAGARVRVTITGLLPREAVRVTVAGRVAARTFASAAGRASAVYVVRATPATQRVVACGVTCSRRGIRQLVVVR